MRAMLASSTYTCRTAVAFLSFGFLLRAVGGSGFKAVSTSCETVALHTPPQRQEHLGHALVYLYFPTRPHIILHMLVYKCSYRWCHGVRCWASWSPHIRRKLAKALRPRIAERPLRKTTLPCCIVVSPPMSQAPCVYGKDGLKLPGSPPSPSLHKWTKKQNHKLDIRHKCDDDLFESTGNQLQDFSCSSAQALNSDDIAKVKLQAGRGGLGEAHLDNYIYITIYPPAPAG